MTCVGHGMSGYGTEAQLDLSSCTPAITTQTNQVVSPLTQEDDRHAEQTWARECFHR